MRYALKHKLAIYLAYAGDGGASARRSVACHMLFSCHLCSARNQEMQQKLMELIGNHDREYGVGHHPDYAHNVAVMVIASVGTLNSSQIHVREVFKAAILANAQAIVFGHNHPSGDLEPSHADVDATHRLAGAGSLLGSPLLYSLIVSQ